MPPPLARVLLPRRARRAGSITVAVAPVAVTAVAVTAVAVPVVTVAVARVAFPTAMVAVAVPRFPVRRHRGARRGAGWKSATKYAAKMKIREFFSSAGRSNVLKTCTKVRDDKNGVYTRERQLRRAPSVYEARPLGGVQLACISVRVLAVLVPNERGERLGVLEPG